MAGTAAGRAEGPRAGSGVGVGVDRVRGPRLGGAAASFVDRGAGRGFGEAVDCGGVGATAGSAGGVQRLSASTTQRTGVGPPHTSFTAARTASPNVCSSQSRHDSLRATTTTSAPSDTNWACPSNQRLNRAAPTRADTAAANRRSTGGAGDGVDGRTGTTNSLSAANHPWFRLRPGADPGVNVKSLLTMRWVGPAPIRRWARTIGQEMREMGAIRSRGRPR